jgi:transposase
MYYCEIYTLSWRMSRHDIPNEKWEILAPLLAKPRNDPRGRSAKDDRLMLNCVLWIMKTGAPWRDLPPEFGPWSTVYTRYAQWTKQGNRDEPLKELSADADGESIMIDASFVKLHQHGAGVINGQFNQEIGRSKGGLTTKVQLVVAGLCNPLRVHLTSGNSHDMVPACDLIAGLNADMTIADKAYDADKFHRTDRGARLTSRCAIESEQERAERVG